MLRVALGVRGFSAALLADRSRSMMITGSSSSEGKSTVALNFACGAGSRRATA